MAKRGSAEQEESLAKRTRLTSTGIDLDDIYSDNEAPPGPSPSKNVDVGAAGGSEPSQSTLTAEAPNDPNPQSEPAEAVNDSEPQSELGPRDDGPDEQEDDMFDLLDGEIAGADDLEEEEVADPKEEIARREFAEELAQPNAVSPERLPSLIEKLEGEAPQWGAVLRWRSVALLCAYVARAKRETRTAFVNGGMPLLGDLLHACMEALEGMDVMQRQSAADWAIACLACLRMLPIGRATMWEHRHSVGKTFDRLHRWCGSQKSHTAAEIRGPMEALCRRWRRQPKPAAQDKQGGEYRQRVVSILAQALSGTVQDESLLPPLSPGVRHGSSDASMSSTGPPVTPASPASHFLPCKTAAAEIEVEMYKKCGGLTAEFKLHARMLRSNLAHPANSVLRERVLSGELSPSELVSMKSEDLAPAELQQHRKKLQKEDMERVIDRDGLNAPRSPLKDGDRDMKDYNMNMAPPALATAREEEEEGQTGTEEEVVLPTPGPMAPPPTPFAFSQQATPKLSIDAGKVVPPDTPDVLSTPAPEDEDEVTALIQRLSRRP